MIKDIKKMCFDNNVELVYLTKFGSHLYGTDTINSDTDYKGIFLPSKDQCILQNVPKSINFSTGKNNSKNTNEDVDINLWSLQYFLKLVSKGETNAIDLLYSFTYPEMIQYKDYRMNNIFNNHKKLFSIKNCNAYIGYALGQAKKYGIKGTKVGVLKNVFNYIKNNINNDSMNKKLDIIMDDINDKCGNGNVCFIKNISSDKKSDRSTRSLVICGKVHMGTITIDEFCKRIEKEYKKYGDRARQAEKNEGIDWKAISHAMRALYQMESLIKNDHILYPLYQKNHLKEIKQGFYSFNIIEKEIINYIDKIDSMLKNSDDLHHNLDQKFVNKTILNFYH
jgi:predicted nucleotidyltransferase